MLELAILGLLENQELHGYEIRRRLHDELGMLSNVSFGSLYPALSRLERAGAVEVVEEAAPSGKPIPMTGSISGEIAALRSRRVPGGRTFRTQGTGRRGRKAYRITDKGRSAFAELLQGDPGPATDDTRSFGLRLAFARYLPPQARLRLLERRRDQLVQRLAAARAAAASAEGRLDAYTRSLVEHSSETTEHDISWLDRLIDSERAVEGTLSASTWPAPADPILAHDPVPTTIQPINAEGEIR